MLTSSGNIANRRVLVIEDAASIRQLYRAILAPELEQEESAQTREDCPVSRTRFDLQLASQGEEGFELARTAVEAGEPFAVAIIDMRMPPGWDGLKTGLALREIDPNLVIVIATGFSDHPVDDLQEAFGHDFVLLRKPFRTEELFQLARAMCIGWSNARELRELTRRLDHTVAQRTSQVEQRSRELAGSETRYRTLIEAACDPILLADFETGEILDANRKAGQLLGRPVAELIGMHQADLHPPGEEDRYRARFRDLRSASNDRPVEFEVWHRAGHPIPVEASSTIMDLEGRKVRLGIFRDLRWRKEAEFQLEQRARQLDLLCRAGRRINAVLDMPVILHGLVETAVALTRARAGAAGVVRGDQMVFSNAMVDGAWRRIDQVIEAGAGISGLAWKVGLPLSRRDGDLEPCATWAAEWSTREDQIVSCPVLSRDGRVMACFELRRPQEAVPFGREEIVLLQGLASSAAVAMDNAKLVSRLEDSVEDMLLLMVSAVRAFAQTVEKRDPYTAGHMQRVALLSVAIGQEMGFDQERIRGLELGALVHDLGKIQVPTQVLTQPGRLGPDEMELLRRHPQTGFDILSGVAFRWPVAEMVLQHHERCDGSGYPSGLRGDQVLLESQIIAVADVVEAMAAARPYRAALGIEAALDEIRKGRGVLYDEEVVDACLGLFARGFGWPGMAAAATGQEAPADQARASK